jgi:hypothetical protein
MTSVNDKNCKPKFWTLALLPFFKQDPEAVLFLPGEERSLLEVELLQAAEIISPMLTGSPQESVLDWFKEFACSKERLERELGTDVHEEDGGHRLLLQTAIKERDASVCLEFLRDVLQLRLPPLRNS